MCQKYKNFQLLKKLRWATLGYHHNWDTKVYTEDFRNEFPSDLGLLSKIVAKAIGYDYFEPQAAIVNFYHLDSTLSGHTDHSEINLEAPLISFSFGQSAIFLLGGKTLEEKPTPLLIHSGDIIIMTKEARLCYHGIPRILKTDNTPWNTNNFSEEKLANCGIFSDHAIFKSQNEELWKPFGQYLNNSRINMNVRQVLPSGQS
ncbi:nucleic acid dioxygenase ALKBH1-like, partial [Agrilus planipennis]